MERRPQALGVNGTLVCLCAHEVCLYLKIVAVATILVATDCHRPDPSPSLYPSELGESRLDRRPALTSGLSRLGSDVPPEPPPHLGGGEHVEASPPKLGSEVIVVEAVLARVVK